MNKYEVGMKFVSENPSKDQLRVLNGTEIWNLEVLATLFPLDNGLILLCRKDGRVCVVEFIKDSPIGKTDEFEGSIRNSSLRHKILPQGKINLGDNVVTYGRVLIHEGELISQTELNRLSKGEEIDLNSTKIIVDNLGNAYRIIGQLAVGGTGEVWIAEIDHFSPSADGSLERTPKQVAMKIYKPDRLEAAKHEQEIGLMFEGSTRTSDVVSVRENVNEGAYLTSEGETARVAMNIMEFAQNAIPISLLKNAIPDIATLLRFYFKVGLFIQNAHLKGRANSDFDNTNLLAEAHSNGNTYFTPIFIDFDQYVGVRYIPEVALQLLNLYENSESVKNLLKVNTRMLSGLQLRHLLVDSIKAVAIEAFSTEEAIGDMNEIEYDIYTSLFGSAQYIEDEFINGSRIDLFQVIAEASEQSRENVVRLLGKVKVDNVVENMINYLPNFNWNDLITKQIFEGPTSSKEDLVAMPNLHLKQMGRKPEMGYKMEMGNPFIFLGKGESHFYDLESVCGVEDYNLVFTLWRSLGLPFQYKLLNLRTMEYEVVTIDEVNQGLTQQHSDMINRLVASAQIMHKDKQLMLISEEEFIEAAKKSKFLKGLEPKLELIYAVFEKFMKYFSTKYLDGYTYDLSDYNFRGVGFNVVEEIMNIISAEELPQGDLLAAEA